MKRSIVWGLGLVVLMGAVVVPGRAEDVLKAGPSVYKLLFENDRVRVIEGTFKPGEKVVMHSHPDHFVYVAKGGSIKLTRPDGTSSVVETKEGQVLWIAAESHASENVGKTALKFIVSELKVPSASGGPAAMLTPTKVQK